MHDEGGGLAVLGRDVDLAFLHGVASFDLLSARDLIAPANTIARKHCGDKMTPTVAGGEMAAQRRLHHCRSIAMLQAVTRDILLSEITDDPDHQSLL